MKKTRHILLTALLGGALLLPSLTITTGCSTVREYAAENPVAANIARAGLYIGLNAMSLQNPLIAANAGALRGVIDLALSEAASPDDAAAILEAQSLEILGDPAVRDALIAAWQAELAKQATQADGTPAAGPEHAYAKALADALAQATPAAGAGSTSHWSDPAWRATGWFSGVGSMQELVDYHSVPPTEAEIADVIARRAAMQRATVGAPVEAQAPAIAPEYLAWARKHVD